MPFDTPSDPSLRLVLALTGAGRLRGMLPAFRGLAVELSAVGSPADILPALTIPPADGLLIDAADTDAGASGLYDHLGGTTDAVLIAVADDPETRIAALAAGADDCVFRDCTGREILARVAAGRRRGRRATLRAEAGGVGPVRIGSVQYCRRRKRLTADDGRQQTLTPVPAALLSTFIRRPGTNLRRDELMSEVWERRDADRRVLGVAIHRLRRSLAAVGASPAWIQSVGDGYRFAAPVEFENAG